MKLKVTSRYCYIEEVGICLVWMIGGMPFTFDDEGFDPELPEILEEAERSPTMCMDDLYRWSSYLIEEECHPILFDMSDCVENYQDVPD